jgi:hypothetical protein
MALPYRHDWLFNDVVNGHAKKCPPTGGGPEVGKKRESHWKYTVLYHSELCNCTATHLNGDQEHKSTPRTDLDNLIVSAIMLSSRKIKGRQYRRGSAVGAFEKVDGNGTNPSACGAKHAPHLFHARRGFVGRQASRFRFMRATLRALRGTSLTSLQWTSARSDLTEEQLLIISMTMRPCSIRVPS